MLKAYARHIPVEFDQVEETLRHARLNVHLIAQVADSISLPHIKTGGNN